MEVYFYSPYTTSWHGLGQVCLCLCVKYKELYLLPENDGASYGCTDFSGFKSKKATKTAHKAIVSLFFEANNNNNNNNNNNIK
jgi:hypothetical protein